MADKRKIKSEASSSSTTIDAGKSESVVVDVGRRRSSCGYCKSGSSSSITHGLWAHSLTVYDYQALLDRGWRRSGCFLYKPEMEKTCCPSYTIRLKASDFVPSKEQARVSKRMQMFLDGSLNNKNPVEQIETPPAKSIQKNIDQIVDLLSSQINSAILTCIENGDLQFQFPPETEPPKASVKTVTPNKRKLQAEDTQYLMYTSNVSFQISAALKRAHIKPEKDPKSIADLLSNCLNTSPSVTSLSVKVKACNGHINFYTTETDATVEKRKSQLNISSSKASSIESIPIQKHNLEIRLKKSTFDQEEYALYRKYQIKVHDDAPDHVTESSYKRFLIDSPLIFVQQNGDEDVSVPPCGFGSFHQQYLVDGKLVAVGVIDILPKCLSSKYLFWDPDFAFLSLGKYSALQEINWVKESESVCSSLQYYYLGYYIHSCNKMRYKAAYRPSELLCPLRYEWVSFDIAKRLLDRTPYAVLSDFATLQDEASLLPNAIEDQIEQEDYEPNDLRMDGDEEMSESPFEDSDSDSEDDAELAGSETTSLAPAEMRKDVSNIVIGLRGMHLKYKDIRQAFGPKERNYLESQLDKYVTAVGTDLSERMIYSIG